MKKRGVIALALACAVCLLTIPAAADEQISQEELVRYNEQTKQKFLASIEGLSEAQWNFKPAPDRWSIAEVAEHLALSEGFLLDIVHRLLQNPEARQRPEGEARTDRALVAGINDRSQRAQAPEPGQPTGRWAMRAELLQVFEDAYSKTRRTAGETDAALLRSHYAATQLGVMDAHQFLLLLAAHRARHTQQIEEVKATEGYPQD